MSGFKKLKSRPRAASGAASSVVVRSARTKSGAVAVHANAGAHHVVGIGDLRVMIVENDGCWFAQGLEIDFAEQGSSLKDAQSRFEKSLADTIREHLTVRGNIRSLLKLAPTEIWAEFYDGVAKQQFRHSCVTAHHLIAPERTDKSVPFFQHIAYHTPASETCATP